MTNHEPTPRRGTVGAFCFLCKTTVRRADTEARLVGCLAVIVCKDHPEQLNATPTTKDK